MTDFVTSARLPCGYVAAGSRVFIAESARIAVPSEATIRRWLLEPELATPRTVTVGDNTMGYCVAGPGMPCGSQSVTNAFATSFPTLAQSGLSGSFAARAQAARNRRPAGT